MNEPKFNKSEEQSSPIEKRTGTYRKIQIIAFFLALFVLAGISWIIPLHPTVSEAEKRELAAFPTFSAEALASGDYFDGINAWFADTFPFRDTFVTLNTKFRGLLSFGETSVHGTVDEGDAIPDQPVKPPVDPVAPVDPDTSTEETVPPEQPPAPPEPPKEPEHQITEPDMTDVPVETLGAILIVGNAAYEYYGFSQEAADIYVNAVNRAAALLDGKAKVYDMIVPTSMDITLPASVRKNVNSSDQRKAMDYFFSAFSDQVNKVDIYDTLRNHRDEYIFYRTDHHWTALGAYYAYRDYCAARGTVPADLETAYTKAEYPGFTGSFYFDSGKKAALADADTITAYIPKDTNHADIIQTNGDPLNWQVVTDVTNWKNGAKYSTFIGGDNPWTVIQNPNKTDGSACIVIKESFGNAFVPFLVPDYQTVYVIDYRYFHKIKSQKLTEVVAQTGAQDVLFINNISATRNKSLMSAVANLVG